MKPNKQNTIGMNYEVWIQLNHNNVLQKFLIKYREQFEEFCKEEHKKDLN